MSELLPFCAMAGLGFWLFLVYAASRNGVLRILSSLGLGIGWAYGQAMGSTRTIPES
jgi:hypothetical protein